ncbi:sigma-70 family RNA polymerase sigma factor [Brevundimonas sp. 2R-24]|uniref:Sigma-70 family RNA polymerase sigma factor n=1 Tax=Peiella sedimenti TaxID=3061083 RepID=A0ABT8SIF7_9CAUL|nr:sigma-70 family RNA polymerase sigma factor [Caulobacteraceae bacterium XZ-24]
MRDLTRLHDVELAALAAAGGRREFGELARRHSAGVRALLRRMGADPATAEDVAQDAFIQAFQSIASFRGEGTFAAWVRRIAARRYLKARARAGALVLSPDDAPEEAAPEGAYAGARLDLDQALKGLSEAERLCVSLCYGAGLSHSEVAEILGAPLGTVKSHVKRGLDKLKARMGQETSRSAAGG